MLAVASFNNDGAALRNGIANLGKCHALFFHIVDKLLFVGIADFHNYTGVLCEECLYHVAIGTEVVQIDVETALLVGETHFQQCGDKTAGRDIVTSHNPSFLYKALYCHESIGEVFGVFHCWHVAAYLAEALCKGRTTEMLLIE